MKLVLWFSGLLFAGLLALVFSPEVYRLQCEHKWAESGLKVRHVVGAGCMIEVDGVWTLESKLLFQAK
jgi:hypothetical protein